MSENKLIFIWITVTVLLIFTIVILSETELAYLLPFLLLLSIVFGYFIYEKNNNERFTSRSNTKLLLDAREKEKKKIASELHDGLQQNLHSISLEIQKASKTNYTPKEKLAELSDRIIDTIDEIRKISSELYPHQLENLGLKKALTGMANTFSDSSNIYFTAKVDNEVENVINKEVSIHIFRIIQELFNNIYRHSGAVKANASLTLSKLYLHIDVEDNGFGFENNIKTVNDFRKGLGISSIQERLRVMNGTLNIKSLPGKGTAFKITIPIKNIYNSN